MAYLKVHQEMITDEIADKLIKICPFNAIQNVDGEVTITAGCKMCRLCVKRGPLGVIEYIDDNRSKVNKKDWIGVVVFVEHTREGIHPVTYELIGKARELADSIKHPVYAILIGYQLEKKAEELLHYGVDKVYVYDDIELEHFRIMPYANVLEDFINLVHPSSVLVGATYLGRSLAPRVAARFRTGLTADCTMLEMKDNSDLVQIRPAFGGNIMAQIVTSNNRPQFCTVRYKVFAAQERQGMPTGEIIPMKLSSEQLKCNTKIVKIINKTKEIDISEASAIIVVGRGMKSQSDLLMIEELAELFNAKVACTRPLVEKGWFNSKHQIGLSGRTVNAKLIITLGVSGAVQFTAGMRSSDCIIAINKDKSAPIFDIAHYGIVGDFYEVIPMILKYKKQDNAS